MLPLFQIDNKRITFNISNSTFYLCRLGKNSYYRVPSKCTLSLLIKVINNKISVKRLFLMMKKCFVLVLFFNLMTTLDIRNSIFPNRRIFRSSPVGEDLVTLQKTPLKMQQKFLLLRNMLLSRYFHQLVLGKIFMGYLKQIDSKFHRFARDLLHLTYDVLSSAFHAPGKGTRTWNVRISCLRWTYLWWLYDVAKSMRREYFA